MQVSNETTNNLSILFVLTDGLTLLKTNKRTGKANRQQNQQDEQEGKMEAIQETKT